MSRATFLVAWCFALECRKQEWRWLLDYTESTECRDYRQHKGAIENQIEPEIKLIQKIGMISKSLVARNPAKYANTFNILGESERVPTLCKIFRIMENVLEKRSQKNKTLDRLQGWVHNAQPKTLKCIARLSALDTKQNAETARMLSRRWPRSQSSPHPRPARHPPKETVIKILPSCLRWGILLCFKGGQTYRLQITQSE